METKHMIAKHHQILTIIAGVGLVISSIFIMYAANEGRKYEEIYTQTGIHKWQQTLQANEAINAHDYHTALTLISGKNSEDYYNRGTIQTLLAYEHALENSISGLETAQKLIAQAQQNFSIAKKLKGSDVIQKAITKNQQTATSLSSVIDIKRCYSIGQEIITSINDINATINDIHDILNQEEQYIDKRSLRLDTICEAKLRYIVDTSKEQVGMLKLDMEGKRKIYLDDIRTRIDDPMTCLQSPYENIIPSINKGKAGLVAYQQLHQHTVDVFKSNNQQLINELCNESKNDAQLNQQIEDSVQELLETLHENTLDTQQKKRVTNEKNHKDFFTENEKEVLQTIQTINTGWIQTILKIRNKGNYDPIKYLNEMFNQFYGNSGDFINLHK